MGGVPAPSRVVAVARDSLYSSVKNVCGHFWKQMASWRQECPGCSPEAAYQTEGPVGRRRHSAQARSGEDASASDVFTGADFDD